jgi:hypothetical protein
MGTNLIGNYHLSKSNLIKGETHLVIGTRHKPAINKPKHYLLARLSPTNHKYISSLYPTDGAGNLLNFTFDYGGGTYQLSMDKATETAKIDPLEGLPPVAGSTPKNQVPLNNNRELVTIFVTSEGLQSDAGGMDNLKNGGL